LFLASYFCLFISSAFSLASSSFQANEKKEKHKEKKNHREEKKCKEEKRGSLPFIWDETLLLLSPFHIPSTLSSPPSSSLVSHVSSKFCATQA